MIKKNNYNPCFAHLVTAPGHDLMAVNETDAEGAHGDHLQGRTVIIIMMTKQGQPRFRRYCINFGTSDYSVLRAQIGGKITVCVQEKGEDVDGDRTRGTRVREEH